MKRFVLAFTLIIIVASIILPQNLKKFRAGNPIRALTSEIGNEYIKAVIEKDYGRFYISTSDGKNILFRDSTREDFFTSHLNIKIDNNIYSNEDKIAKAALTQRLKGIINSEKTFSDVIWTIDDKKINVTQRITPVKYAGIGGILIECFLKNNDSIPHNAGLLYEFDTQINTNDGSPIHTNYGLTAKETTFVSPKIPIYWQAYENIDPDSGIIGQGNLKGTYTFTDNSNQSKPLQLLPPDEIFLSDWEKLFNILWDYNVNLGEPYYDSGILLKWLEKIIQPDSTLHLSTYIGIGNLIYDGVLSASINVPKISFTGQNYLPDPFELNIIVQNTSNETISDITGNIKLAPGLNLVPGTSLKQLLPTELLPLQTGILTYLISANFQVDPVKLPIDVDISANTLPSNRYTKYVQIPAAPGVDFFPPTIELSQSFCSYIGFVEDTKIYDRGIDTIITDSTNNTTIIVNNFSKGEREVKFTCSLIDQRYSGFAAIRAVDLDGNFSRKEINIFPNHIGFDSLNEVVRGKNIFIPVKIFSKLSNGIDTSFSFTVSFDSTFLSPSVDPVSIENSQSSKFVIKNLEVKDNEISVRANGSGSFHNGTLFYLKFLVKSKQKDTTDLILQDFVLNNEKNCIDKINSKIIISSRDTLPPVISYRQFGSRYYCKVFDTISNSKGIYSISLSYSDNAELIYSSFEPGINDLEFILASKDSTRNMDANILTIDGSGNFITERFRIHPAIVKIDTIRAQIKEIIKVSPEIQIDPPDSSITNYEFTLRYDSTVIKPINPFYSTSNTTNREYTIYIDTSKPGQLNVKGQGGSKLTSDTLLDLFFIIQPGTNEISPVEFTSFLLNNGEKAVLTQKSAIIRIKQDTSPPLILSEQKRNKIKIKVIDWQINDLGIQSIVFSEIINFPANIASLFSSSNNYKYFEIEMLDSTKGASLRITVTDIALNQVSKKIEIVPVILSFPQLTEVMEDENITLPIKITNHKNQPINQIQMKVEFDPGFMVPLDTFFSKFGTLAQNANILFSKDEGSVSFNLKFLSPLDSNQDKLIYLNFKIIKSSIESGRISFSKAFIYGDSLLLYGSAGEIQKLHADLSPPEILTYQTGCSITAVIKEIKKGDSKIKKIWLDSLVNFKDTLFFINSFSTSDSISTINIFPLDSKQKSSGYIFAEDNNKNIGRTKVEIKPLTMRFPESISFRPESKIRIPLYIDGYEDQKINKIELKIKYDKIILSPEDSLTSTDETLIQNSQLIVNKVGPDTIVIKVFPNMLLKNNVLLYLNFKCLRGDSSSGEISLLQYSINNDTLCTHKKDGKIFRTKITTDTIFVSIDTTIRGKIGSLISIPVKITNNIPNLIINSYKAAINYNGTLLTITSINTKGTLSENLEIINLIRDLGSYSFEARGNFNLNQPKNLISINAKVLLGNDYITSIILKDASFVYDTSGVETALIFKTIDGFFTLDSLYEWQKGLKLRSNYLFQNHPNPYNSTTSIAYNIEKNSFVKLIIYDVLGRIVSILVNEYQESGFHSVPLNSNNLTSGIYFYRIEVADFIQTKKMVLIK
jgi:hypothetical protein